MKTRNTLIALAVAASALTGMAAPAFADTGATVSVGYRDSNERGYRENERGYRDNERGGRWDDHRGGGRWDDRAENRIENRIDQIRHRIDQGRRNGQISRREGERLQYRLRDIVSLKRSYERSGRGLNRQEVATLEYRLDNLSGQVRSERHDVNRW
ncbi:17 kDa surface antigen [Asticcacaulis biprosthecium C19]|uniref:17 kDa surface antigen n=1 Tax=Asticcacaulis biprosthecium C19 TaxID=715226 RepID=F4QMA4_9CAUL|nr:DUF4148 domain-containing protein [Asticcacaulis biprosthecium]EGF91345.1 17 kDa surface antigen [Asticcacaulis biprosthecium C19]